MSSQVKSRVQVFPILKTADLYRAQWRLVLKGDTFKERYVYGITISDAQYRKDWESALMEGEKRAHEIIGKWIIGLTSRDPSFVHDQYDAVLFSDSPDSFEGCEELFYDLMLLGVPRSPLRALEIKAVSWIKDAYRKKVASSK